MKIVRIVAIAALAAGVSTAAQAGGYSFQSVGFNYGKGAYGDAGAHGDAKLKYGKDYGKTWSKTDAYSTTTKVHETNKDCNRCGKKNKNGEFEAWTTMAQSGSINRSGFETDYGHGSAQSHSSAVAGSGVGAFLGFKAGNFEPRGRHLDMNNVPSSQ
ncbi:hypothetical protein [Dichotomicrobium thermohalophilum]|uniref:Uncharacterized protein n=1 Tax=Dichotomicrobium thermohalophilum TaxID=933063 RepID=A0A397PN80_9HYPH|nr:hypothetical protein [Dichotomicrobium thermohalophilum]RIA47494.1 hypothetical protein BXY53_2048 [Dichotomicrobium thermohalophilum]